VTSSPPHIDLPDRDPARICQEHHLLQNFQEATSDFFSSTLFSSLPTRLAAARLLQPSSRHHLIRVAALQAVNKRPTDKTTPSDLIHHLPSFSFPIFSLPGPKHRFLAPNLWRIGDEPPAQTPNSTASGRFRAEAPNASIPPPSIARFLGRRTKISIVPSGGGRFTAAEFFILEPGRLRR
jgi:hypothetical protein